MRVRGSGVGGLIATLALWLLTAAAWASPAPQSEAELANQTAAEEDARHLLEELRLPPGAAASAVEPSAAPPALNQPATRELRGEINLTGWWTVPGEPDAILDWIKANPPQESTLTGGGSSVTLGDSANTIKYAEFVWPPVPGVLSHRALFATVGGGMPGTTFLRANAQVTWFLPRPASEQVPASAHVLEVIERRHLGDRTVSILSGRAVQRIIAVINGLPISQPGGRFTATGATRGCPKRRNVHQMELTFRGRRNGPALAEAHQEFPSEYCHPMYLKIGGQNQPPLEGSGVVIRALRRIFATRT